MALLVLSNGKMGILKQYLEAGHILPVYHRPKILSPFISHFLVQPTTLFFYQIMQTIKAYIYLKRPYLSKTAFFAYYQRKTLGFCPPMYNHLQHHNIVTIKPGLHEPQMPVERSSTLVSSVAVERRR